MTALNQLSKWILDYEKVNGTPTMFEIKLQIEMFKEIEKKQIIEARQDGHESTYNSCESGCMGREVLENSNESYYLETFKDIVVLT
jgi:hypothetical protein